MGWIGRLPPSTVERIEASTAAGTNQQDEGNSRPDTLDVGSKSSETGELCSSTAGTGSQTDERHGTAARRGHDAQRGSTICRAHGTLRAALQRAASSPERILPSGTSSSSTAADADGRGTSTARPCSTPADSGQDDEAAGARSHSDSSSAGAPTPLLAANATGGRDVHAPSLRRAPEPVRHLLEVSNLRWEVFQKEGWHRQGHRTVPTMKPV